MAKIIKGVVKTENQISICKRAAIENMATAFTKRGTQTEKGSVTKVEKLHSKIGQ